MIRRPSNRESAGTLAIVLTVLLIGSALVPVGGAVTGPTESTVESDGLTTVDTARSNATLSLVVGESTGESVPVTLESDASDVAGYGANVTFDPDIVAVDAVSGVDMSDPTTNIDIERGWVFFTQSQASGIDQPTLAELTFTVQATGETALEFEDDTTVNDATPEEIPVDLDGTTISVEEDGSGGDGVGGTGGDGIGGSGGDGSGSADGDGTAGTEGDDTDDDGGDEESDGSDVDDGDDEASGTDDEGGDGGSGDADGDESDGDGGGPIDSLPGFGIVPALIALCAALAARTGRD